MNSFLRMLVGAIKPQDKVLYGDSLLVTGGAMFITPIKIADFTEISFNIMIKAWPNGEGICGWRYSSSNNTYNYSMHSNSATGTSVTLFLGNKYAKPNVDR